MLKANLRSGVCSGHTLVVKDDPSGCARMRYQNPYASDPAATFPTTTLSGLVIQKVAGVVSVFSSEWLFLVQIPRLPSKTFSVSPPSSTKKVCPITLKATLCRTRTRWVPWMATARLLDLRWLVLAG